MLFNILVIMNAVKPFPFFVCFRNRFYFQYTINILYNSVKHNNSSHFIYIIKYSKQIQKTLYYEINHIFIQCFNINNQDIKIHLQVGKMLRNK